MYGTCSQGISQKPFCDVRIDVVGAVSVTRLGHARSAAAARVAELVVGRERVGKYLSRGYSLSKYHICPTCNPEPKISAAKKSLARAQSH